MSKWSEAQMAGSATDWVAVALFMATACAWSAFAVRWSPLQLPATVNGLRIDDALLVGMGPTLGAMVARMVRPGAAPRMTSLLGRVPWTAWLALAAPIATAALFGLPGDSGPALAGLVFAATVVLYCLGEEIGWRGWLFDALGGLRLWQSAAVTAPLWYAWHWTFLDQLWTDPAFAAKFALFIAAGTAGLAQAVARSRSVGIAAAIHAALKVMLLPAQIAVMVAILAIALWKSRANGQDAPLKAEVSPGQA